MHTVLRLLSNAFSLVGGALLLLVVAYVVYDTLVEFEQPQPMPQVVVAAVTPVVSPTPLPSPSVLTSTATKTPVPVTQVPTGTPVPSATPLPTPTPTPLPKPATRIVAPAIKLDAPVVESMVVNKLWQVPKHKAGHLQGTAHPGQGGNIVMAGHLESISSGNVFADIGDFKPGDTITLYTEGERHTYKVTTKAVVAYNDLSVVRPTQDERLTLITCTGTFDYIRRDYDKRTIVVATKR